MDCLKGIRILDCSQLLPGPFATHYLAEMGAEVIKVESLEGDPLRHIVSKDGQKGMLFETINRNKKSVAINLKHEKGREAFFSLLKTVDVLVEGFRPGVTESLGIGYESCQSVKPDLIYISVSGWGQEGSLAKMAGHDLNYLAVSGLGSLMVDGNNNPQVPGMQIADISGSSHAIIALLAALLERNVTGTGKYIDISMLEGTIFWGTSILTSGLNSEIDILPRSGILLGEHVCYQVYETKDKQFVTLGAIERKFWVNFCDGLGKKEWIDKHMEKANGGEFHKILVQTFQEKTFAEWIDYGLQVDCCLFPVLSPKNVWENEHVRSRNLLEEWVDQNGHKRRGVRIPMRVMNGDFKMEKKIVFGAPLLGQDTLSLLEESGFSHEDILQMRNEGSIRC